MISEKEKAAQGMLYDANHDKELLELMEQASLVLHQYNLFTPNQKAEKEKTLKTLFKEMGENITIRPPFFCDYGSNITVGDNFFANVNLVILDAANVQIGSNVFVGPNVGIYTAGHPLDMEQRNKGLEYAYPVTIGNNVWIGAHVCILPGISIGHNAVIGAGSVVTRNIPPNVLAMGNPCRVVKDINKEHRGKYTI